MRSARHLGWVHPGCCEVSGPLQSVGLSISIGDQADLASPGPFLGSDPAQTMYPRYSTDHLFVGHVGTEILVLHHQVAAGHFCFQRIERATRWPRDMRAVCRIGAAVTWAHKFISTWIPGDSTAEMSTNSGQRFELATLLDDVDNWLTYCLQPTIAL